MSSTADGGRSALPLPDYDHLPIGGLESRVRSPAPEEVETLLSYERTHADRLPVTEVPTARLEQLDAGAEQTSGDPQALRPETRGGRDGSPRLTDDVAGTVQPALARHPRPAGQAEGRPHPGPARRPGQPAISGSASKTCRSHSRREASSG